MNMQIGFIIGKVDSSSKKGNIMAHQYIIIKKYINQAPTIYYHVRDHLNKYDFYVGIDLSKKEITYYNGSNFESKPLAVINFSDPAQPPGSVPGIKLETSNRINIQLYNAFKNNHFPDDLSYVSL